MRIKNIKSDNVTVFKDLLHYCFGLEDENLESFAEFLFDSDHCLGIFEDDQLAASLTVIPYEIYYNNNTAGMGGISAVATFPEYRNKHYAEELLKKSLKIMKKRGDYFSFLNPFSYSFYRKYGWELALEYKKYELEIDCFKQFKDNKNCNFIKLDKNHQSQMNQVYNYFVKKYNGPVKRNKKIWQYHFKEQKKNDIHRFGCLNGEGELEGYIFFKLEDHKMKIRELCYTSPEIKQEIFRFIYSHRAQVNKVNWRPACDDNTIYMLSDPEREHETSLGMMWRIVDVKKVMESFTIKEEVDTSFTLKVEDPHADWNNKMFEIKIKNSQVVVKEIKTNSVDVICSIQALSQLISGYISLKERIKLGGIKGDKDRIQLLEYFVPERSTYLNDYF
ncbi:MAG: GNAT family N-acetyltransferase [Bacillota bacterium]